MQSQLDKEKLIKKAEGRLRRLSREKLRVAEDFLAYLEEKEETIATQELLNIPDFEERFQQAAQQAKSGKITRLDDIRRDV
ncbi:MAG: hypothetical protein IBX69_18940 [Anaerolineales bacterium]|nr:hypothetical protein [Anaerolineales bacterium]